MLSVEMRIKPGLPEGCVLRNVHFLFRRTRSILGAWADPRLDANLALTSFHIKSDGPHAFPTTSPPLNTVLTCPRLTEIQSLAQARLWRAMLSIIFPQEVSSCIAASEGHESKSIPAKVTEDVHPVPRRAAVDHSTLIHVQPLKRSEMQVC